MLRARVQVRPRAAKLGWAVTVSLSSGRSCRLKYLRASNATQAARLATTSSVGVGPVSAHPSDSGWWTWTT